MDLKEFLESAYQAYHLKSFIDSDPVQIPHRFSNQADIEIAALLTATIAWGQRKSIIRSAAVLMELMNNQPHHFIVERNQNDWGRLNAFVHRTFQPADLFYFMDALRNIYRCGESLEKIFSAGYFRDGIMGSIMEFRREFLAFNPLPRTLKHVSDPSKGSAAKRLNLLLMWMCREDNQGIHFGLWKEIPASDLIIPLDLHVGRVARQLGLLNRPANDWKSALELTGNLRQFDPIDPTRYDFALFCTGLNQSHV